MLTLFDTHAHYNDDRFNDYPGGADAAIKASFDAGIAGFINCGTTPQTSLESIEIANKYENVYAAVGLHPEDAPDFSGRIDETLDAIKKLSSHNKVVALGEIGLDYHWDIEKDLQHDVFDKQLSLAEELSLPVIIHDRDAHGKTLEIIKLHKNVIGVMHGFSGSAETAREYVNMGWYLAFGGPLTYKNSVKTKEACVAVPADRLLIETDCPYLPPQSMRGKINYSALMFETLDTMSSVRGCEKEELCRDMLLNTERLFGIKINNI